MLAGHQKPSLAVALVGLLLVYMHRIMCDAFTENVMNEMLNEIMKVGLIRKLLRMKEIVWN